MKINFLADTNFLIHLHEGKSFVAPFLDYLFGISFITEIELLGHKNITKNEEIVLKKLLKDSFIFNFNDEIKLQTIELKRNILLSFQTQLLHQHLLFSKYL